MRYPKPLIKGSKIAITAPSCGVDKKLFPRLDLTIENLNRLGFEVVEGKCLREQDKPASDTKENRAADFMELYCREDIAAIFPPWGGELAIDILPLLDWDKLKTVPPKWIIGYSDTSTILLPFTTLLDMATLHGANLMDLVEEQTHPLAQAVFETITTPPGDMVKQKQSNQYQARWDDFGMNPKATYNLTESTQWKSLNQTGDFRFNGRIIGGCIDTIMMLTGTKFGRVSDFTLRYAREGIILYLENCELPHYSFHRALLNLKLAGWMDHLSGILIGRSPMQNTNQPGYSYMEALENTLGDLEIPILIDVDIGHMPPNMSIINGSKTIVIWEGGKGEIIQELI